MLQVPQSEVSKSVSNSQLREDRQLNLIIKILSAVFILALAAFIGYYSYTKYSQKQETPQQKAVNLAIKLIRANPQDTAARVRLGVLYTQAGKVDAAIAQFDEVLTIERDNQEALLYAGIAYMNKEEYDNALKYFNKEVRYYKNTSMAMTNTSLEQAYYYGGVAYWKKKDKDKAIDYLNKSLAIKPAASDTYLVLGRVYLEKKIWDAALDTFTQALKFDPQFPDALYGLGLAYEGKGDKKKALENFQAALKAKPDFKEAKEAVARLTGSKA